MEPHGPEFVDPKKAGPLRPLRRNGPSIPEIPLGRGGRRIVPLSSEHFLDLADERHAFPDVTLKLVESSVEDQVVPYLSAAEMSMAAQPELVPALVQRSEQERCTQNEIDRLRSDYALFYARYTEEGTDYLEESMRATRYEMAFLVCRQLNRLDPVAVGPLLDTVDVYPADKGLLGIVRAELEAARNPRIGLPKRRLELAQVPARPPLTTQQALPRRERWIDELEMHNATESATIKVRAKRLMNHYQRHQRLLDGVRFDTGEPYREWRTNWESIQSGIVDEIAAFHDHLVTFADLPGRHIAAILHTILAHPNEPYPEYDAGTEDDAH